jgi:teichuronic acid biosynthesis glycosyltransferase TuaH
LPSPVAGFVGHVSQRIDVALLEAVARRGISLLLVGPVTEGGPAGWDDLLKLPNVLAVGRQEHADLPSFYAAMDVGLTPYADTAFNRASYPLKTLEYLAAGLPVVSSDLPATHSLNSQLVVCAASPAAFASAVEKAAADAHEPALVQARRDLAAEHSWARRADQVLAAMGLSSSDAARSAPVARMGGDHR